MEFNSQYICNEWCVFLLCCRNIEEIVYFGGSKPSRVLTYGTKQLVAREIDMEKMRRFELAAYSSQKNSTEHESAMESKNAMSKESKSIQSSEFLYLTCLSSLSHCMYVQGDYIAVLKLYNLMYFF